MEYNDGAYIIYGLSGVGDQVGQTIDEREPGDGQKPVRAEQKGGSGRQDTGHGQRSIANDQRSNGHSGHEDNRQRPVEEQ